MNNKKNQKNCNICIFVISVCCLMLAFDVIEKTKNPNPNDRRAVITWFYRVTFWHFRYPKYLYRWYRLLWTDHNLVRWDADMGPILDNLCGLHVYLSVVDHRSSVDWPPRRGKELRLRPTTSLRNKHCGLARWHNSCSVAQVRPGF